MGIRRNIGGKYVEARERDSSKGRKGTIMKKWSSKKKDEETQEAVNINAILLISILIIVMVFLYFRFFY